MVVVLQVEPHGQNAVGPAGTINTGGGGGGGGTGPTSESNTGSTAGGSGIVIYKVQISIIECIYSKLKLIYKDKHYGTLCKTRIKFGKVIQVLTLE